MHPSIDPAWLDTRTPVTLEQLVLACGVDAIELDELLEYGVLSPAQDVPADQAGQQLFSAECVAPLRAASSMRVHFDLDLFSMSLLYSMLSRIDALERQLKSLQARLPAHLQGQHDTTHEGSHDGSPPWHELHAGTQRGN